MQGILNHRLSEVGDTSEVQIFVVSHARKFEISELCGMFLGRWSKYIYLLLLSGSCFLFCVAFSAVAGSSWAVNLPVNFGDVAECNSTDFLLHTLPVVIPCRNAYWFCLFLFACIVVPLSMIGLREQAIIQMILSFLRFITVGAMLIFCIANLIAVENICTCKQPWNNYTNPTEVDYHNKCNVTSEFEQITTHFDVQALTVSITVMVGALGVHVGIPLLSHPVEQKKHLGALLHVLFLVMTLIYMMLNWGGGSHVVERLHY